MMASAEHRMTETPRKAEVEANNETHRDERLLPKLRTKVTPAAKS